MSLMPTWARELSGFTHGAASQQILAEPLLHTYARTLRWAFGTPPFRALADERVSGSAKTRRPPATLTLAAH
jgi:hypothetical protein